jgi:hypothetical protein
MQTKRGYLASALLACVMVAGYLLLPSLQSLSAPPAWPKQLAATTTSTSPQGGSQVIRSFTTRVGGLPKPEVASHKTKRPTAKKYGTSPATTRTATTTAPATNASQHSAKPDVLIPGAPMNTSGSGSESSTGSLPGEGDVVGGSGGG